MVLQYNHLLISTRYLSECIETTSPANTYFCNYKFSLSRECPWPGTHSYLVITGAHLWYVACSRIFVN